MDENIHLHRRVNGRLDELHTYQQVLRFSRVFYGYSTLLSFVFAYNFFQSEIFSTEIVVLLFVVQITFFVLFAFAYGNLFRLRSVQKRFSYKAALLLVLLLFIFLSIVGVVNEYAEIVALTGGVLPMLTILLAITQELLFYRIKPDSQ